MTSSTGGSLNVVFPFPPGLANRSYPNPATTAEHLQAVPAARLQPCSPHPTPLCYLPHAMSMAEEASRSLICQILVHLRPGLPLQLHLCRPQWIYKCSTVSLFSSHSIFPNLFLLQTLERADVRCHLNCNR